MMMHRIRVGEGAGGITGSAMVVAVTEIAATAPRSPLPVRQRSNLSSSSHIASIHNTCTSSSSLTCNVLSTSRRAIHIQNPKEDIKAYWRKETERIRDEFRQRYQSQSPTGDAAGVNLGSAEAQSEAMNTYFKMLKDSAHIVDYSRVAWWTVLVIVFSIAGSFGSFLSQRAADASEAPLSPVYTPYEPPQTPERKL